ncbi:MAG: hypothetical protein WCS94_06665 [Verrucomicrobiota bacterium]
MKFRKFTKRQFLEQIGRGMLGNLFGKFDADLTAHGLKLPAADAPDDDYFAALSRITLAPDALPDNLIEALFKIEEMANDEGHDRLLTAAQLAKVDLKLGEETSFGDVAVQVYLANPDLLAEKHNEQRLIRLAKFEYYGGPSGLAPSRTGQYLQTATEENSGNRHLIRPAATFSPFEAEKGIATATVDLLTADLDAWFAKNNRGEQTAHVEVYPIDGEFWFLIRHGDAFARTTKLMRKTSEVLHFRPAKDDVVVYSPKRDEIRIHASTKGERELYRTTFGLRLFGDDNYFCNRKTLTLEPLRLLGIDALDVSGIAGLAKIVLRELEIAYDNKHHESVIRRADDLFAAAADAPFERAAIPAGGRLVRATFDFYFTGCKTPRKVQVKPSNTLKLGRHCDAATATGGEGGCGGRRRAGPLDGLWLRHVAAQGWQGDDTE